MFLITPKGGQPDDLVQDEQPGAKCCEASGDYCGPHEDLLPTPFHLPQHLYSRRCRSLDAFITSGSQHHLPQLKTLQMYFQWKLQNLSNTKVTCSVIILVIVHVLSLCFDH